MIDHSVISLNWVGVVGYSCFLIVERRCSVSFAASGDLDELVEWSGGSYLSFLGEVMIFGGGGGSEGGV